MSQGRMSLTEERIKQCGTPMEALLLLARAIDELQAQLDEPPSYTDPWEQPLDWATHGVSFEKDGVRVDPTDVSVERPRDEAAEAAEAAARKAKIAEVRAAIAACTDPQEAKALNAQLWLLMHPGIQHEHRDLEGRRAQEVADMVNLPEADAGRKLVRRQWAQTYHLDEFLRPADPDEVIETYVKGGPLWLYHTRRDVVMQLPLKARQLMVQDIEQDSVAEGREVGRDILKIKEGMQLNNAVEAIQQISQARQEGRDVPKGTDL